MFQIPFNIPPLLGKETEAVAQAIIRRKICGDGPFTKKCNEWIENNAGTNVAMLTTSCTHALEMSALLADIRSGDEVIMPSFTFTSTANAFVLRGARIVFIDIRHDTMNMDEKLIEAAVTPKTKAIVPVHYAGVACEMDEIMAIAQRHKLFVIEDAAQGVMSRYKGRALGAIGNFGCFSFHETKNYSCGEGGALLIQDINLRESAEIIREKGTNRGKFLRGQIDKYTWVDSGSSYLPSEINAAYLSVQLDAAEEINRDRLDTWYRYYERLSELTNYIELPVVPEECMHNAHMFYIKTDNIEQRTKLIEFLAKESIQAVFHYVPLHSSPAGQRFGEFHGTDKYTTRESERLLRLPLYYGMSVDSVDIVVNTIKRFFTKG